MGKQTNKEQQQKRLFEKFLCKKKEKFALSSPNLYVVLVCCTTLIISLKYFIIKRFSVFNLLSMISHMTTFVKTFRHLNNFKTGVINIAYNFYVLKNIWVLSINGIWMMSFSPSKLLHLFDTRRKKNYFYRLDENYTRQQIWCTKQYLDSIKSEKQLDTWLFLIALLFLFISVSI